MNWLGFVFMWLGAMAFWYAGFIFGKKVGHMAGHRCEAVMQIFYEDLSRKEEDGNERI